MKLSDATTATEILDVLVRRAWYENYEQECPDHQIPTPADLLKWMEQFALDYSGAGKLEPLKLQRCSQPGGFYPVDLEYQPALVGLPKNLYAKIPSDRSG